MTRDDRGVHIGGGADVSGQISTGDHSVQIQGGTAASQVSDAFDRFGRLLERHADEVGEADKARRDLADLQREAAEDDPDHERMEGALGRLSRRVASVAVLAEAVRELAAHLGFPAS